MVTPVTRRRSSLQRPVLLSSPQTHTLRALPEATALPILFWFLTFTPPRLKMDVFPQIQWSPLDLSPFGDTNPLLLI